MGCAARPGSESRADACVDSPGTREIPKSPPENNRIGAKPVKQSPWSVLVSGHRRAKTDRAGSIAERAASEAPEMEQGSLSALIVPMESWETVAGSQGVGKGGAEMGLLFLPYSSPFLSVSLCFSRHAGIQNSPLSPSPCLPLPNLEESAEQQIRCLLESVGNSLFNQSAVSLPSDLTNRQSSRRSSRQRFVVLSHPASRISASLRHPLPPLRISASPRRATPRSPTTPGRRRRGGARTRR